MARYHIVKSTRLYEGRGYAGPSATAVGAPSPVEVDDLEEARRWTIRLNAYNPVGWNVFDAATGECVIGFDQFG